MEKQIVTNKTSQDLVRKGLPVPELEVGQVWLNKNDGSWSIVWGVNVDVRFLTENSQHFMSVEDFLNIHTPGFSAPDLMAWARSEGERISLTVFLRPSLEYEACNTSGEIVVSHNNPAEAVAGVVIKSME